MIHATKTLDDLVEWILVNRKGNAFSVNKGWEKEQIASSIVFAFQSNTLLYCTENNEFVGVVVGTKLNGTDTIVVQNILVTKRGVLKKFVQAFQSMYPGCDLRAKRKGKLVNYNTTKLCSKIKNLCK